MASDSAPESPAIDALEPRLRNAGYEVERQIREFYDGPSKPPLPRAMLGIYWPSGKKTRRVWYSEIDADKLAAIPYQDYEFLSELDGIFNSRTGAVEARIATLARFPGRTDRPLASVPGFEFLGPAPAAEDADDVDVWVGRPPRPWRLCVTSKRATIELSYPSPEFQVINKSHKPNFITLKISGMEVQNHDSAQSVLQDYGRAFLFDLNLRYGVGITLGERRTPQRRRRTEPMTAPPSFPRNRYPAEPLALYNYGRSASGLPLLEYLAFYQTIEFFFPVIAQEETVRAVGTVLRNPRFDYSNEASLRKLIATATQGVGSRGRHSEREQLRITVRAVLSEVSLKEFIESITDVQEHLCGKEQAIKGVQRILLQGNSLADLRDQVADRVYSIRCRIVHTKDEAGDTGVDLLLPSSREAMLLGPDVSLVRMLAEQVLISRALPLPVK